MVRFGIGRIKLAEDAGGGSGGGGGDGGGGGMYRNGNTVGAIGSTLGGRGAETIDHDAMSPHSFN